MAKGLQAPTLEWAYGDALARTAQHSHPYHKFGLRILDKTPLALVPVTKRRRRHVVPAENTMPCFKFYMHGGDAHGTRPGDGEIAFGRDLHAPGSDCGIAMRPSISQLQPPVPAAGWLRRLFTGPGFLDGAVADPNRRAQPAPFERRPL